MAKIILDVADENLDVVQTILDNLKVGLILSQKVEKSEPKTVYTPPQNRIIREEEQMSIGRKYLNPQAFKAKLHKKV